MHITYEYLLNAEDNSIKKTITHIISEKGYLERNGVNVGYHVTLEPGVDPSEFKEIPDRYTFHFIDGPVTHIEK